MLPVHIYGMAMDTSVTQNQGTAAGLEAVIATGSAREGVCHIIYLVTLLLDGILTMSNFLRQGPCMLSVTRADAVLVWSLARSSTTLMTNGILTGGRLHNTVASPARALHPHIALDLFLVTTKTLTSDTREATSLHRRNEILRTISNQRSLPVAVVLQLTRTRLMHHLASLDLAHHLVPRLPPCLHHRLHVNHHKFLRMALAETLRFLARHRHPL